MASYDVGLRIDPHHPELLNRRGVALFELGRPQQALEDFDRVLETKPDHLDALGNCGNALLKLNRVAEALAVYDRALRRAPENAQLLTNRAVALRRLDRPQEAVMSASRALVSKPDFAQARFVESVARLTLGDFSALARLRGALVGRAAGVAAPQFHGAALARRCAGSTARPSCCMPSRVLAIPFSSCVTRLYWRARGEGHS